MKEIEARKQSELMASQQLKKMIPQLLLSVSLFSFVFSYSSFYSSSSSSSSSSLLYSSKFHYLSGTNSFHFLSHVLNKNCLFLICNGLLVFVAKTSGFIRPPSEHHDLDEHSLQKSIIGDDMITAAIEKFAVEESGGEREITEVKEEEEEMEKSESPEEVAIFIAESEEEGGGGGGCDDLDKDENDLQVVESRRCWLFNDDDDDDDDQQQLYDEELEEEEDDDDEREEMSTEELNQKFEEFIRRMKKEIVINEARQRSVVMVN